MILMRPRHAIMVLLAAVGVVLFLPLIIPIFLVWTAVEVRRKRKAAASFACVTCGQILGAVAIQIADNEWREHVKELRRTHPFAKFRLVRTCDAICATCSTRYTFRDGDRTFVLESPYPPVMHA